MRQLLPVVRPLDDAALLDLYGDDSPALRGGFVLSTDGGVAADGSSRPLQTPADQLALRTLRSVSDALLVGAGTARAEDYGPVRLRPEARAWREARGRAPDVPLVLVTRSLELDPSARCFSGPVVVVTCAAAAGRERFPDVVVAGEDDVDLVDALHQLRARGLSRLVCEGGPQLLTSLLRRDLVDELCLTLTPLLLGPAPGLLTQALDRPWPLQLASLVDGGDGVLARYRLQR